MKNIYLKKYITKILITLISIISIQNVIAQTSLFSTDFSTWGAGSVSYCTASSQSTFDNYGGIYFLSNSSTPKPYSITIGGGGNMTWCNNNMSSSNYFIAIPITGVNGEITVTITIPDASGTVKSLLRQENSPVTSIGSSGTTRTASSGTISWTETGLASSNYVLYLGRASSSYTQMYTISITTPASCTNPSITGQPSTGTQTLCESDVPTDLSITATGATAYQWYSSTDAVVGGDTDLGSANGAQTATFTPSTASAGTLYYYCIASDGACTTTTNLTGLITVNTAPAISSQPNNATAVISGSATTMSVTASDATGYQWQYCATSGGSYTNVVDGDITGITYTSATSATLNITAGGTASAGTGYYKCIVSGTSPCANTTSSYGTLTISASLPTSTAYETFVWKTDQTACTNSGSQTSLVTSVPSITISGTGSYSAGSSYNINAIGEEIIFTSTKDITSVCFFGKIQPASIDYSVDGGSTYQTLNSTDIGNDALYTISTFAAGAKTFRLKYTEASTVGVWLRNMTFTLSCTPATISSITGSQTVSSGDSPVLTVSASANNAGTLTYQWYDGGGALSGETGTTYTATNITSTTTFYCIVAEDGCEATSNNSVVTVTATAPTTQASNISFSGVSDTDMTIDWTRGDGANVAVFMKQGTGSITNPSDASSYSANTTLGSGTQLGSSGYYCIYNGTGTSVAISGLTLSTTYTIQIFEYNGSGATTLYNTSTATNNPNNQATTAAPTCTTIEIGYSTGTSMPANGVTTTLGAGTNEFTLKNGTGTSTTSKAIFLSSGNYTCIAITGSANTNLDTYYIEGSLTANSANSQFESLEIGMSRASTPGTVYGILYSSVYPFDKNFVISGEDLNSQRNDIVETHATATVPATAKSFRLYRKVTVPATYGDGSSVYLYYLKACIAVGGTPPTVTTQAVTSTESSTATGNFTITDAGDGVTSSGVCWSTATGPTTSSNKTTDGGTSLAAHTGSMTSLTGNTTYYVKGYATGAGGTGYGAEVTTLTKPATPTIAAASSVTSTSFVANWTAPSGGTDTYTLEIDITAGNFSSPIQSITLISSGNLSQAVASLSASTGYKYRVIAVNTTGSSIASAAEAVTTSAPAPEINVTQAGTDYLDGTSTYNYGTVTNASSSDITFTIQNTGAGDLTISSTSVTGDAVFTRQTDPTGTITTGNTATITVRFTPTSSIAFSGTLTINSNDGDEGVYTISLSGTGTTDLTAPTGLVSSAQTNAGFTIDYNTVGGASSGYETKVCQIDATPTNVISQTNTDIQAWTSYPIGKTCTDITDYTIDFNGSTTQSTADGTYTLLNSAVINGSGCPYILLGKPEQTTQVSHGSPAADYWEGGNTDITGDAINDGGIIVFPEVASAGTLTINAAAFSGTAALIVEKSTDGGISFTQVGSATSLSTSATTLTKVINEINPVIIRIRDVIDGSNVKWIKVNSFSMTNYMDCGSDIVIASQATATYNFTGLNPNTLYFYTIRSKAGATYSRWSTSSVATTETTLSNPPSLTATSSVTSTGMTINWSAPAIEGTEEYTYTLEYGTDAGYSGAFSLTGLSSATLTQALTGLTKNTTYYYRLKCENISGGSSWDTGSQATLAEGPTVTTTTASAVTTTTASSGGDVTDDGGSAITDMGLAYDTSANPTSPGLDEPSNTIGVFSSSLTGLTPNTAYYYRAYATNANGTSYGSESSFISLPNPPTVGTGSSATTDGFTANWSAPGTAGSATYTYTVEVSTNAADFTSPDATATSIASGTTSYAFTGLSSFVSYYYRVKCVNTEESSAWSSVSTAYATLAGGATVLTSPVDNITATGADAGGEATSDGGDAITVKGVVYKTTSPVTAADNPTADGGAGTGVFAATISGLSANTKYYYRAYATNGNGAALGTELNFTTLPDAPVIGIGNTETGVGFTANWTAPVSAGTETYTYEVEVTTVSGDYTTPIASYSSISSASLSQDVTGLSASTTYYYRVRVANSEGYSTWSTQSVGVTTLAQKTLTITFTNGTVTANGSSITSGVANIFSENEEITIEATPANGYGFLRWVVNGVQNVSDNPYTITLVDNTTVTANFAAAVCESSDFDTSCDLNTSNVSNTSFADGANSWYALTSVRLNTSSSYAHSGNNSVRLYGNAGAALTYESARPVSFSCWARMYNTNYSGTLKVFISTDGGTTYDATPIINEAITGASWQQVSASISTTSSNVKFKIYNATGLSSTSYDIVFDDVEICEGPDASAPTLTFTPTNASTSVSNTVNPTITSTEALYRYNTSTGALIQINAGSLSGMHVDTLATFLTLTKVSDGSAIPFSATIDGTGKIITVTPTSSLAYQTEFKLSIRNVGDINGNIIPTTIYTQFTTEVAPIAIIEVKEMSPWGAVSDGATINMGTIISQPNTTKTFKIYNTGNANLTFTESLTSNTLYTITTAPSSPVLPGDSTTFVITFTPVATGTFTDVYSINSNDATNPLFELNLQGGKAAFVLPYTYESGCTSPIISGTEFKHDYTSLNDIPAEVSLKNGSAIDEDHFFANYSVFHVEGNCMPQGSSALRVGQDNNGLKVHLTTGCGQVTVKWAANGYRKIKITDNSGNIYEQSPSYQIGGVCYTTTSVLNVAGDMYVNIEFIGTDPALLTTVYYLEITPYNADLKSSARNILNFSTTDVTENVRIYDDVVLITVDGATDRSALATDLIQVSPFATISPAQGTTQDYSSGPVTYTVTAQNGLTKTYNVYVDAEVVYSGFYTDSVQVTVPMGSVDQILEVIEISNASCNVPVSGTGSSYTLHFLDVTDNPGTYLIGGTPLVCIGSTATFSITNAPAANNPTYVWSISGAGASAFTTIGSLTGPTLTLRAPDTLSTADLSLGISVDFGAGCAVVNGTANKTIDVTDQPPAAIDGLTASCATNGMLTIVANGSNDATTYNWNFTPSTTQILIQTDSSIIVNVGTSASDISAAVNTQNGCGVTENATSYDIDYAQNASTWTGAINDDWTNPLNWTGRVPQACTDVIIPDVSQAGVSYPTITAAAACHYITFKPGAGVLGLENLVYEKAFVQAGLQRSRWYTLTPPLKELYTGDFGFMGAPMTQMMMFDAPNPDTSTKVYNNWSKPFASQSQSLPVGSGFAVKLSTKSLNYPNASITSTDDKTLTFPKLNSDSSLVESYIPFNALNGRPYYASAVDLNKNDALAYRFASENGSNLIAFPIQRSLDSLGLHLVGNPMMTHLDFSELYADNSSLIDSKVKFWNGAAYTTLISDLDLWSSGDYNGDLIAPMQAFIIECIQSGGGTLNFQSDNFVADVAKNSVLRSTRINDNLLYIETNNGLNKNSSAIALREIGENQYDKKDAFKLFANASDVAEVYTMEGGRALDINVFKNAPYTTPLGVRSATSGKIQLTFKNANSFRDVDVYLVNTETGENQNLKELDTYTLNTQEIYNEGKLFVEFRNASVVTDASETNGSQIQIMTKDDNVIQVISSPNDLIKEVSILDETGKLLIKNKDLQKPTHKITMNNGAHIYIVKVTTEFNTKISKVLIK